MKEKILISLIALLLIIMGLQYVLNSEKNKHKYEIVPTATVTILLDKTTGETWRNSICQENSNIPACWEKMNFIHQEDFILPIGEQRIRNKDLPKYLKEKKKQEETVKKSMPFQQGQPEGSIIQLGGQQ